MAQATEPFQSVEGTCIYSHVIQLGFWKQGKLVRFNETEVPNGGINEACATPRAVERRPQRGN